MNEFRERYDHARTGSEARIQSLRSVYYIERYAYLLLFCGYIRESKPKETMTAWMASKPEIAHTLDKFRKSPEEAFKRVLDELPNESSDIQTVRVKRNRSGNILNSGSIMKSDHFPGCQRMSLLPHIKGGPNYRQVPDRRIFGCAIPTSEGIQNILDFIGIKDKKFTWISLREEPVIYINGRPFVLRDYDAPYSNLEYTGISNERVEEIEEELKKEIVQDSLNYEGRFLIHDETDDFQLKMFWEEVTPQTVLTPRDCYQRLQQISYPVTYLRLAVTDEQAPQEHEFDTMTEICLKNLNLPSMHLLWNCQMGRGRTTTGMVVATLVDKFLKNDLRNSSSSSSPETLPSPSTVLNDDDNPELRYPRGEYVAILRLVQLLPEGTQVKSTVDNVIDTCNHMQNLRQDIDTYRKKAASTDNPKHKHAAEERGINYLKRYFLLMCFTAWLMGHPNPPSLAVSFEGWMKRRAEFYSILNRITLD